ncbi:probable Dephospho-CoA kinase [Alteracholeplasma palmae J233]|uniref:Dephospho-CoA kinase n=1 Tax=Alteracholeplasma palmae (strain ATCC 49389 / J233) TaxID=1318466 RepID=U4KKG4_ALTPJ|nr:dephospho-CoA kinase [Alteracholeplasma palmae]CCV64058.1 probable Dephospho-CoA kinase [Alteracholeplasma palmae J233]
MSAQPVKKNKLIGLTGGIATGKTTVSNYLENKGYYVIDSDKIVNELMNTDEILNEMKKFHVVENNTINRKALADIIFTDSKKREKINQIIHPKVFNEIEKRITAYQDLKPIFIDMPLLIETGYYKKVDAILLVYTTKNIQIERLMKRNNLNQKEAEIRLSAQMLIDEKRSYATHIIDNSGTIFELNEQIDDYLKKV